VYVGRHIHRQGGILGYVYPIYTVREAYWAMYLLIYTVREAYWAISHLQRVYGRHPGGYTHPEV